MTHTADAAKLGRLKKILKGMGRVLIAFSGGVDSSFLLKVARDTLGRKNILAVVAKSRTYPAREHKSAVAFARRIGADCLTIYTKETKSEAFLRNPVDRCYYCKKELFGRLKDIAAQKGFKHIADGFNRDDENDLRFGRIAGAEAGVRSPLREAGIKKKDIRAFSKKMGLPTWNKPALACLASRFPYGARITFAGLKRIDRAEELLQRMGFRQVRVRAHGDIARIEVLSEDIERIAGRNIRSKAARELRKIGFCYVALDMDGYRAGSMNEILSAGFIPRAK